MGFKGGSHSLDIYNRAIIGGDDGLYRINNIFKQLGIRMKNNRTIVACKMIYNSYLNLKSP